MEPTSKLPTEQAPNDTESCSRSAAASANASARRPPSQLSPLSAADRLHESDDSSLTSHSSPLRVARTAAVLGIWFADYMRSGVYRIPAVLTAAHKLLEVVAPTADELAAAAASLERATCYQQEARTFALDVASTIEQARR